MDWIDCPVIEQVPGKMSGAPVLRNTRIRIEDIIANYDEGADGVAEQFGLQPAVVRAVFSFWEDHGTELPMEYFPPDWIRAHGADIDWSGCPHVSRTPAMLSASRP